MNRYIAYVEDDEEDIEIFKDFFCTSANVPVVYFKDGNALLQHLHQTSEMPCLILLDMSNPVQSGDETIKHLTANLQLHSISLILFSSSIQLPKAKEYQAQGYLLLEKPATPNGWDEACKKIMERCQQAEPVTISSLPVN